MIKDLDQSLAGLLAGEAAGGSELAGARISFHVPDADWRGQGTGLDLSLYLYRIVENRELRSHERRWVREADGYLAQLGFPPRIECSYLVTAWNKATEVADAPKELQEHRLLSQVLMVLFRNPVLPRRYLVGQLASQELDLPLISAQMVDDASSPDFWSGLETYLRPAIHIKATFALAAAAPDIHGPAVRSLELRTGGETTVAIGGTVRAEGAPVRDAWVRIEPLERVQVTGSDGGFVVEHLAPGTYTLRVRARGFQEATRVVAVPAADGLYDVSLIPL